MTRQSPSLAELCERFLALEQSLSLPTATIDGVFFWKLLRAALCEEVSQECGVLDVARPKSDSLPLGRVTWNALWRFPLRAPRRARLVVLHSRKVEGREIYTERLLAEIDHALTIDRAFSAEFLSDASCLDLVKLLARLHATLWRARIRAEDRRLIRAITDAIRDEMGVEIDRLEARTSKAVAIFRAERVLFRRFLRWKDIKSIHVVVGTSHHALVAAARDLGIESFELQHSALSPVNLGHHFPDWPDVPYVADTMLTFGDFWKTAVSQPRSMSIETYGAPQIVCELRRSRASARSGIAVMSQGIVGKALFAFCRELAPLLPEETIVFRLHPSEDINAFRLRSGDPAGMPPNLVLADAAPGTYALLARARFVLGVASTTLYEALVAGAAPIVVKLDGHEYLTPLVERWNVPLVPTAQACAAYIRENSHPPAPNLDTEPLYRTVSTPRGARYAI